MSFMCYFVFYCEALVLYKYTYHHHHQNISTFGKTSVLKLHCYLIKNGQIKQNEINFYYHFSHAVQLLCY